MKCEQFLFEAAYFDPGGRESLGKEALGHLDACQTCQLRFRQLRFDLPYADPDASAFMTRRLHDAIDLLIAERSARPASDAWSRRAWLQVGFAFLVLVGSIASISYPDLHSHSQQVYIRR